MFINDIVVVGAIQAGFFVLAGPIIAMIVVYVYTKIRSGAAGTLGKSVVEAEEVESAGFASGVEVGGVAASGAVPTANASAANVSAATLQKGAPTHAEPELVAVFAAAIASMSSDGAAPFRIVSYRKTAQTATVWNLAGRQEYISGKF